MTGLDGWKVYRMNDWYWYVARSPGEALETLRKRSGYKTVEEMRRDGLIDAEPHELSDYEMDTMRLHSTDNRIGAAITFRKQLENMYLDGENMPGLFTATEF
jgi:hypothetical protein